jgi:epoxyqueuosine reductase
MTDLVLTPALLAELAAHAETLGLLRLGAVDLEHPGFEPARAALDRFLAAGKAGDMDFLRRTRDVRRDPAQMLPGAQLLVAAVPYTGDSGPVARYARTRDYHTVIHQRLIALERLLRALPARRRHSDLRRHQAAARAQRRCAGRPRLHRQARLRDRPRPRQLRAARRAPCTAVLSDRSATAPTGAPWDACGAARAASTPARPPRSTAPATSIRAAASAT